MKSDTKKLIEKLLKEAKPIFEQVDKIGKIMREQDDLDLEFYLQKLSKLTGCYTYITPRYKKLRAIKTNEEVKKYMKLKIDNDTEGEKKFVSSVADREASDFVRDLRLARDIFEGYMASTEASISTCKYYINSYYREKEINKIVNS